MRTQKVSTGNCDSLISAASSLLWVVIYFTSPAQGAATCGSRSALCSFTSGLSRPWKPPPSGDMVPGQLQQSRGQVQPRVCPPQPPCCPCSALATGPRPPALLFYQLTRKCLIQTISLQRASHLKNCYVVIWMTVIGLILTLISPFMYITYMHTTGHYIHTYRDIYTCTQLHTALYLLSKGCLTQSWQACNAPAARCSAFPHGQVEDLCQKQHCRWLWAALVTMWMSEMCHPGFWFPTELRWCTQTPLRALQRQLLQAWGEEPDIGIFLYRKWDQLFLSLQLYISNNEGFCILKEII